MQKQVLNVRQCPGGAIPSNPTYGLIGTGADSFEAVVTTASICTHLWAKVGAHDMILSLDGTTDNVYVPSGGLPVLFDLEIPSETTIEAKNATAGSAGTDLVVMVW